MHMIAIITINYNLSTETIPCVESILASTYNNFIVYLIDNGSKQEDYQKLLDAFGGNPKVQILRIDNNCGYVGGVNTGLKKGIEDKADYFLVMNNDTIIDKEAIGYLVDAAKRYNNKAVVSGKVYYFDNPDIIQHTGEIVTNWRYLRAMHPGRNEKDVGQFSTELERDVLDDVFWLLPAEVVNVVGLYSHYFFLYAEQGDYSLRVKQKGFKLIFTPNAKIWHKVSMTTGGGQTKSLAICYWRGQGLFVLQNQHIKTKYFIVIVIKTFIQGISKVILKKGNDQKCAQAMLRGYFWGFCWMFNKKPNNGYNPYLVNPKN